MDTSHRKSNLHRARHLRIYRAAQLAFAKRQAPASTLAPQLLQRLEAIIEAHLDDGHFDVTALCREIGLSRSQLHRRLKALTGHSTTEFIRRYRLRAARKLLHGGQHNVSDACYAVGFNCPGYFSKCFVRHYGSPPVTFIPVD
ncbi:MAG: AraC family transcriptional regulator [Bacteroidota bacterium]